MKARYQYRINPTPAQQTQLTQPFGYCRVVWNDALAPCKQSAKLPKNSDLQTLSRGEKVDAPDSRQSDRKIRRTQLHLNPG